MQVPFIWHIREMIYSNNKVAVKRLKMANELIAVSDACKKNKEACIKRYNKCSSY